MRRAPKSAAVTIEDFAAQLSALSAPSRLALAVSGGRDSMALLRLSAAWAEDTGATVKAYTVDHGYRAEAAQEARQVKAWCDEIGVAHETLSIDGPTPKSGLQEAARNARYFLLAEAAVNEGFTALVTAHSADDLAETVFMRLRRGAGLQGMAAMSTSVSIAAGPREPIRLLRPLLNTSRQALTSYVQSIRQSFVDDPSNDDPNYERVKVRALLGALEENDLLPKNMLVRTAQRMSAALRTQRAAEENLFRHLNGCIHGWGGASISRLEENPALCGLCARLVFAVSGEAHPPNDVKVKAAIDAVTSVGAATLGGALIKKHHGQVWFMREPAAILGRADVAPKPPRRLAGPILWDRRFILTPPPGGLALDIAPLGAAGNQPSARFSASPASPPNEALASIPAIFRKNALIGAAGLPFMPQAGVVARSLVSERFSRDVVRFFAAEC